MSRRHGRRAGQWLALALLVAASLALAPGLALAHANLERSTPSANAILTEAPTQTVLWFSEEPEIRLTSLRLLDPSGREVAALAARPAPADPRAVIANLPALAPGTYVIGWRTTSAVDGHTTAGAFPFTFGVGQVPASVVAPGMAAATPAVSPIAVFARFLTFTGAVGLVGGLTFGPIVLWPAMARVATDRPRRRRLGPDSPLARAGRHALGLTLWLGAPMLLVGGALLSITQAADAASVSLLGAVGEPLARVLVGTRAGTLLGLRIGLLALAVLLAGVALRRWDRRWWIAALCPAVGVLATVSLSAHAAASATWLVVLVAVDLAHLVAVAIWVGGLAQLGLVLGWLRRRAATDAELDDRPAIAAVAGQFARTIYAVAAIVATGLIQTLVQVGSIEALVATPYGQTLILKLLLFATMAALGLLHWRAIVPRLSGVRLGGVWASVAGRLGERFRWTIGIEAALGVGVLLLTGLLTAQQPARDAAIALRSVVVRGTADDLAMTLEVAPGEAGLNRIELRLSGPLTGLQKVVLRVSHLDMAMGEQEIALRPAGDGVYVADGGQLSMSGRWQIEPLVRRNGRPDARVRLTVPIAEPLTARESAEQPPFELTPRMIVGAEAIVFGLLLVVGASRLRRRSAQAGSAAVAAGIVAVMIGGYVGVAAYADEMASAARRRSPIVADADALARGRALYQQNCLSCHGVAGRGDGPLGRSLNPRPADLRAHVTQHPEGQLFDWITNGVPGTAMPSFRENLSPDDRWRVIAFIKGFAEDGPAPARTAAAEMARGLRGETAPPTASVPGSPAAASTIPRTAPATSVAATGPGASTRGASAP